VSRSRIERRLQKKQIEKARAKAKSAKPTKEIMKSEVNPEDIYQHRYVAFLDRLGFKQFVDWSVTNLALRKAMHEDLHFDHASEYRSLFSEQVWSATRKKHVVDADVEWTSFSDSIVISCNATEEGHQKFLMYLCHLICIRQAANLFIRGGLTVGLAHHEDNVIFGPAMNRAYELESNREHAKYPRIILEPSLAETLDSAFMLSAPSQETGVFPAFESLRRDDDGTAYMNTVGYALARAFWEVEREQVCRATGMPNNPNPGMWRDWPGQVKYNVENLFRTLDRDSSAYEKMVWFANYFNDAYFNNILRGPEGAVTGALATMTGIGKGVGHQFAVPIQIPD
jgi:hypothetical protein